MRVHAGADGGDEAVEFGLQSVPIVSCLGDLGGLCFGMFVGFEDGSDGLFDVVGVGEGAEPTIYDPEDSLFAHGVGA